MTEALSPGVAYGCLELLRLVNTSRMSLAGARNIHKLGVVSANRVIDCAFLLKWLEVDETGKLVLTVHGSSILGMSRTEDRLRQALLDIIVLTDPPWAQNARYGRRTFLKYAPPEITQICNESGLTQGSGHDVVLFWDYLSSQARGLRDVHLNDIGRKGEMLTIEYERRRTNSSPKWIAIDSNEDGYDVLSQLDDKNEQKLCIEVKTSSMGLRGNFYVTRNEWDSARTFMNYQIHLWDISGTHPLLAIVNFETLAIHIPIDQMKGRWENASLPFSTFDYLFSSIA